MRKSLLELQCLEEKKIYEELKKVDNAEHYYGLLSLFKKVALTFFIMNLLIICIGAVFEFMVLDNNGMIVNLVIMLFS